MEERQIIVKNQLITYYVFGVKSGAERAIVFLHGWRSNSKIWFPIINLLPQNDFSVYALDLPGFGKSQIPAAALTLQDYAEAVRDFIEKFGLSDIILVGHSFGGSVAIKIASENPKFLRKLVLLNSAGIRKKTARLKIMNLLAVAVKPFFLLPILRALRPKIYFWMKAEDYMATPYLKETFLNIINENLEGLLKSIKAKTLIVWGNEDRVTPLLGGEIMRTQIPHSKLIVFPNTGHFSFLDYPQEFCKSLLEFIKD